jgi:phage shock protein A
MIVTFKRFSYHIICIGLNKVGDGKMKVLNQIGKWIAFQLDNIAKIFISQEDLLDISLQEREDDLNNVIEAQAQLKTARKNLEDALEDNKANIKSEQANVNQYVKKGKDENAKISIRAKLEMQKQNELLEVSVKKMAEKEELMKRKIEMLKQVLKIQTSKAQFIKTVSKATRAQLRSVDINNNEIDTNKIMQSMSEEIRTMDNRMSALDEMEADGTINRDSAGAVNDAEVDEELDAIKASIKK